ncbi:hypothetical protein DPEC_G00197400 [Dallia pectoralis]|uniref:Uncharacterized protein n=1 Tax=Dallia pectoralis TaxID=75939 RepID=A0ACC2G823_DALPE|nr:hypothetical protein DPEC_G00197400 [Dallia pectoralis]
MTSPLAPRRFQDPSGQRAVTPSDGDSGCQTQNRSRERWTGSHSTAASARLYSAMLGSESEVQEWLCLNCQMQRALGMDMETPRSKSQQQIHSPSHHAKPELTSEPQSQAPPQAQSQAPSQAQPLNQNKAPTQAQQPPGANRQTGPGSGPGQTPQQQRGPGGPSPAQSQGQGGARLPPGAIPLPGMAKAPSQPDLRGSPAHQPLPLRQDHTRSAGSSPSRQPPPPVSAPEQTFGKLFGGFGGFGASLLNQASTLISADPVPTPPQQQVPKPAPKPAGHQGPVAGHQGPVAGHQGPVAGAAKLPAASPGQRGPQAPAGRQVQQACCPLCKTNLNVGVAAETPNYNTCTQCHAQVCNLCGFNPAPHLENTFVEQAARTQGTMCCQCAVVPACSGPGVY